MLLHTQVGKPNGYLNLFKQVLNVVKHVTLHDRSHQRSVMDSNAFKFVSNVFLRSNFLMFFCITLLKEIIIILIATKLFILHKLYSSSTFESEGPKKIFPVFTYKKCPVSS